MEEYQNHNQTYKVRYFTSASNYQLGWAYHMGWVLDPKNYKFGSAHPALLLGIDNFGINAIMGERLTALHLASRNGDTGLIDKLVNLGAEINIRDWEGNTPLHKAGSKEAAQRLLYHGANAHARNNAGNGPTDFGSWDK